MATAVRIGEIFDLANEEVTNELVIILKGRD